MAPLTALVETIVDNRGRTCPTVEDGIPLIATNCLDADSLFPSMKNVRYVSEDTYSNWFRGHAQPGDVLIVNKGTPGRVAFVPDPVDFCFAQDMVALRTNDRVKNKYLFAALRSPQVQSQIRQLQVGSTIPHFKKTDFDKLLIPIPSMHVQEFVGALYFELSLKILNNIQSAATLEAIAQTLFKSWFMDFEPVKAKMAGEKPEGIDSETAALFPSSMVESDIGVVPNSWSVKPLDEVAEFLNGLAMQKFPVSDPDSVLPVIKIAQLKAGNTIGADEASGLIDSRYVVRDGDVLFSWSGTLEVEMWAGGLGALNQHLFKVDGITVPNWFSFLATKNFLPFFRAIASSKATTMGHIQRGHLTEAKLAIPPLELLGRASEIFEPLLGMRLNSLIENRNLAELRDTLLPRLISGELQIPEEMLTK